jgi:hypothetical protein
MVDKNSQWVCYKPGLEDLERFRQLIKGVHEI